MCPRQCVSWTGSRVTVSIEGLAAMPTRERALGIDGRDLGGDQSYQQRQHREAMARNTSPKESGLRSSLRADVQSSPLDDADWDHEHDESARHRARRPVSYTHLTLPTI